MSALFARSAIASALVGLVLLSSCGDQSDPAGSASTGNESDAGASHLDDGSSEKAPADADAAADATAADASRSEPTSPEFLACKADCRGCCTASGECKYIDIDQKAEECLDVGEVRGALCHSCAPGQMCWGYASADATQPNRPAARCWVPAPLGTPCTDNSDCRSVECDPSTRVCTQSCRKSQEICQGAAGAPVIACCDPRAKCTLYAGYNQSFCCFPAGTPVGESPDACGGCCQGLHCNPDPGDTVYKCRPPPQ